MMLVYSDFLREHLCLLEDTTVPFLICNNSLLSPGTTSSVDEGLGIQPSFQSRLLNKHERFVSKVIFAEFYWTIDCISLFTTLTNDIIDETWMSRDADNRILLSNTIVKL